MARTDGIYTFWDCVPDGSIDIANVSPGDIIQRSWSFRCNYFTGTTDAMTSSLEATGNTRPSSHHPHSIGNVGFDPRNILRGYNGYLMNATGTKWYAFVPTWQAQFNFSNSDYQAAGQKLVWAVPQSFTVSLTLTETVIMDSEFLNELKPFIDGATGEGDLWATVDPVFAFQGILRPSQI